MRIKRAYTFVFMYIAYSVCLMSWFALGYYMLERHYPGQLNVDHISECFYMSFMVQSTIVIGTAQPVGSAAQIMVMAQTALAFLTIPFVVMIVYRRFDVKDIFG